MASTITTATAEQLRLIETLRAQAAGLEVEVGQHQMETARRVNPTRVRRCGRCRCPGHTRGRCNVFIPSQTHYMDLRDGAETERVQLRLDVRQVREIRESGRMPITRYEALMTWLERPDTDYNAISDNEIEGALNEERSARARMDAALAAMHAQELGIPQPAPAPVYDTPPRQGAAAQYYEPSAPPAPAPAPSSAPVEPVVVEKPVEETTCAICLEELTDCNKMITACGHQYHANCLIKTMAMTKKTTCPTCRKCVV